LPQIRVQHVSPLKKNLVLVVPGIRQVTVTPVSFNSARNAMENESMKASSVCFTEEGEALLNPGPEHFVSL